MFAVPHAFDLYSLLLTRCGREVAGNARVMRRANSTSFV